VPFFQLVPPDTKIDFISKWRLAMAISWGIIVLGAVAALPQLRGIRYGIDFAGGTEILFEFPADVAVDEGKIREVTAANGLDATVVRYGEAGAREYLVRFPGSQEGTKGEVVDRLQAALSEKLGTATPQRVDYVGPKVGADLREAGLLAVLVSSALILLYVAFRFSARYAPGAVVATVHDVLITCAIWVLLGLEFDLQVLAAVLTIVGYSINDTIIVYDRIRENMALHTGYDLPEVVNRSVNQTLSRTLLTGGTTLVALLALLAVGGETIRPFSLAMVIGILVGTYSSIYVASPVMILLEQRFGAAGKGAPASAGASTPARPGKPPKGAKRAKATR
jgi:preprotein translocase subunit SecF